MTDDAFTSRRNPIDKECIMPNQRPMHIVQRQERAVLAAIEPPHVDIAGDLEELQELVSTAGAEVVDAIIQRRALPDGSSFLGKGKVEELQALVREEKADLVIVDADITGTQQRNLQ